VSKRKRKSRGGRPTPKAPGPIAGRKLLAFGLPVLLALLAIGICAYVAPSPSKKPIKPMPSATASLPKVVRKAKTLDELLKMPAKHLGDVDIAEVNLLCAMGLPGTEKLDIDHALATLDRWAARVAAETKRHLYRVTDPRYADHYRHSEAYLRAEFLVQVLYEDLGVKYDMTAKDNFNFDDSRVAFIHGMIPVPGQTLKDTPGGTCASMPVMITAVGRRLGYPLKLVTTKGHVFVRWEGKSHWNPAWRQRFNIEGTNGFSSHPDDHYKTWPFKLTDHQVRTNGYLLSLTPMEEFAMFLASRGHCGEDNKQPTFAARCYENAYRYDTRRPCYRAWAIDTAMRTGYRPVTPALAALLAQLKRRALARGPAVDMGIPMPSAAAAAAAAHALPAAPSAPRVGPWQHQPATPGVPQPPTPHVPQPGIRQPHQPRVPGQRREKRLTPNTGSAENTRRKGAEQ